MSTDTLEIVTRLFVLVGYTAVFTTAIVAYARTEMWSRKVSTVVIAGIAVFWFGFYLWLAIRGRDHPGVTQAVLTSRVGHYFTASGLFVMANMISRSDRYGVAVIHRMHNGGDDA